MKNLLDDTGMLDDLSSMVEKLRLVNKGMEIVGNLSAAPAPVNPQTGRCLLCSMIVDSGFVNGHKFDCAWRAAKELVADIQATI